LTSGYNTVRSYTVQYRVVSVNSSVIHLLTIIIIIIINIGNITITAVNIIITLVIVIMIEDKFQYRGRVDNCMHEREKIESIRREEREIDL
jgi:multisubunit Na+/H+ antiporter MnhF subunit